MSNPQTVIQAGSGILALPELHGVGSATSVRHRHRVESPLDLLPINPRDGLIDYYGFNDGFIEDSVSQEVVGVTGAPLLGSGVASMGSGSGLVLREASADGLYNRYADYPNRVPTMASSFTMWGWIVDPVLQNFANSFDYVLYPVRMVDFGAVIDMQVGLGGHGTDLVIRADLRGSSGLVRLELPAPLLDNGPFSKKFFWMIWYDKEHNIYGLRSAGQEVTVSGFTYTNATLPADVAVYMGSDQCTLDEMGHAGRAYNSAERAYLYNGGQGHAYRHDPEFDNFE